MACADGTRRDAALGVPAAMPRAQTSRSPRRHACAQRATAHHPHTRRAMPASEHCAADAREASAGRTRPTSRQWAGSGRTACTATGTPDHSSPASPSSTTSASEQSCACALRSHYPQQRAKTRTQTQVRALTCRHTSCSNTHTHTHTHDCAEACAASGVRRLRHVGAGRPT